MSLNFVDYLANQDQKESLHHLVPQSKSPGKCIPYGKRSFNSPLEDAHRDPC